MKKIILLLTAFCFLANSFASFTVKSPIKKASEIFVAVGNTGQKISLSELSIINVKDFEKLSGKHLKFVDRLVFKASQKKLKNSINPDGTINNTKLAKYAAADGSGFNIGGFALGFFLGLIGVLITYLINNENNQNRRKWTWIGFGVAVVVGLLALLI